MKKMVPTMSTLIVFIDFFQILDPMIDDLDLLLHHGHPSGEVVVLPDFPGQLVQLGFRDGLRLAVCDQNANQCNGAGDDCGDNAFHWYLLLSDVHMDKIRSIDLVCVVHGQRVDIGQQLRPGNATNAEVHCLAPDVVAVFGGTG